MVQILEVIVVMFETTGGLVRGHLVKNSCLTVDTKFWGKWQKYPPQKANFFVYQPNGMKFLQQVSDNILGLFAQNNNTSNSASLMDIKENVF